MFKSFSGLAVVYLHRNEHIWHLLLEGLLSHDQFTEGTNGFKLPPLSFPFVNFHMRASEPLINIHLFETFEKYKKRETKSRQRKTFPCTLQWTEDAI